MHRSARALVAIAFLAGLAAGCTSHPRTPSSTGTPAAAAWGDDIAPAPGAGTVGRTGCALPVSFDVPRSWTPKAVAGDLGKQGDFRLRCEIDAKPAGYLGFLRVWAGGTAGADPTTALRGFLAADHDLVDIQQRTVQAGALPAAEATYLRDNQAGGARKRERVLAVRTPTGVVVLALGGIDTQEHEKMLPAYQLARQTMSLTN